VAPDHRQGQVRDGIRIDGEDVGERREPRAGLRRYVYRDRRVVPVELADELVTLLDASQVPGVRLVVEVPGEQRRMTAERQHVLPEGGQERLAAAVRVRQLDHDPHAQPLRYVEGVRSGITGQSPHVRDREAHLAHLCQLLGRRIVDTHREHGPAVHAKASGSRHYLSPCRPR
jgi:hypothetical protein